MKSDPAMLNVLPFSGLHFDWRRVQLSDAVSPPYDVIPPRLGKRLRRLPQNAIHVELPLGNDHNRYDHAKRIWQNWQRKGWVVRDPDASYFVLQQQFSFKGKSFLRTGLLAALKLDSSGLKKVTPHEKTLSKPKKDRQKLLRALHANTSPIFALYKDPDRRIQKILGALTKRRPDLKGKAFGTIRLKVWRIADAGIVKALRDNFRSKTLLVADGHHRLEVSRAMGSDSILCYLCAQEDPGLLVLPTHRLVETNDEVWRRIEKRCRIRKVKSLAELEGALGRHPSSLAFGIITARKFMVAAPKSPSAARRIHSGLGVEWLAKEILEGVDAQRIRYTHEAGEAEELARGKTIAIIVKPVDVRDIFQAVRRVGLLPQKSTYFYPKVEAGIVFNPVQIKR